MSFPPLGRLGINPSGNPLVIIMILFVRDFLVCAPFGAGGWPSMAVLATQALLPDGWFNIAHQLFLFSIVMFL